MITCRYCGTSYTTFQTSCQKCGGALQPLVDQSPEHTEKRLSVPPPAPRPVPRNYAWRILSSDGWAITAGVFLLLGVIFAFVGIGLTLGVITAFVGLPFAGLGLLMLAAGIGLGMWRYQEAQKTVEVLQSGEAVLGEMVDLRQNLNVRVNGRHPWTAVYRYTVDGRQHEGKMVTLKRPEVPGQAGKPVYVLYRLGEPGQSTIYPHPYWSHRT